ncbi:MAG: sensor domain-containing protein [Actinomycetota bacterium]
MPGADEGDSPVPTTGTAPPPDEAAAVATDQHGLGGERLSDPLERGRRLLLEREFELEAARSAVQRLTDEKQVAEEALIRANQALAAERAAVKQGEDRFGALVQYASDVVVVVGVEGAITYLSPSAERLFGYSPEEMVGMNGSDLVHPDDLPITVACFGRAREPRSRSQGEYRVRNRHGSWRWVETVFTNLVTEPAVSGYVLNSRDVTERRLAEEARRRSEDQLARAQELAKLGRWEWQLEGDRLTWSEEIDRIFGAEPGHIEPSYEAFLRGVHDEDRALVDEIIRRAIATGSAFEFEARFVRMDETVRIVSARGQVRRDHRGTPTELFGIALDITDRTALEEQIRHRALHDPLTDLGNRALFLDRVGHTLQRRPSEGRQIAVLFVDLDNFKTINDSLGHTSGDLVLVEVARRLRTCMRPADTIARLGGDEFALLVEEVGDLANAERIAERIREALRPPFHLQGREVYMQASVGIAYAEPGAGGGEELLRNADIAMFAAKRGGRGGHAVFHHGMHAEALDRLELEADLRVALRRDELLLEYQPIVVLADGRLAGAEALVRWEHPRRGRLLPAVFIPLAEETGLIHALGKWVLARACGEAAGWSSAPDGSRLYVSVNVSSLQFNGEGLLESVTTALRESGLPASSLTLEITESVLMERTERTHQKLRALSDLGIHVAIDDFGTGYSSLSYLGLFPVDVLKIDRAFVVDVAKGYEEAAVARAVVSLAGHFRMETLAEGIEEPEQAAALRNLGCALGQGYLYARPLGAEAFRAFIATPSVTRLPPVEPS